MKFPGPLHFAVAVAAIALAPGVQCAAAPSMAMKASPNQATVSAREMRVESAWVRAAPPGATMLAGYLTLHNDGKSPMRLESAESDAFGMVELHRTLIVNGVSTMRPSGEQIIPAGGSLRIEPGGLHLMLMQPRHDLKVGENVRLRLHFADGSMLDVIAPVGAQAPAIRAH